MRSCEIISNPSRVSQKIGVCLVAQIGMDPPPFPSDIFYLAISLLRFSCCLLFEDAQLNYRFRCSFSVRCFGRRVYNDANSTNNCKPQPNVKQKHNHKLHVYGVTKKNKIITISNIVTHSEVD